MDLFYTQNIYKIKNNNKSNGIFNLIFSSIYNKNRHCGTYCDELNNTIEEVEGKKSENLDLKKSYPSSIRTGFRYYLEERLDNQANYSNEQYISESCNTNQDFTVINIDDIDDIENINNINLNMNTLESDINKRKRQTTWAYQTDLISPQKPPQKFIDGRPGFSRELSVSQVNLSNIRDSEISNKILNPLKEKSESSLISSSNITNIKTTTLSSPTTTINKTCNNVNNNINVTDITPIDPQKQTRENNVLTMFFSFILVIMLGSLLSRVLIIIFGFLYPAYSSFKTIRSANVKQYVRWMMYWVVFALFTASEHVTDVFLSWLPFYYEIKVLLVIWLSSTYTRGASVIYRKVLHPLLARRERHIDKLMQEKQGEALNYLLDAGKRTVQSVASGAMSSIAHAQGKSNDTNFTATVAATGLASSVMNTMGSIASNLTTAGTGDNENVSRQRKKKNTVPVQEESDGESFEE